MELYGLFFSNFLELIYIMLTQTGKGIVPGGLSWNQWGTQQQSGPLKFFGELSLIPQDSPMRHWIGQLKIIHSLKTGKYTKCEDDLL